MSDKTYYKPELCELCIYMEVECRVFNPIPAGEEWVKVLIKSLDGIKALCNTFHQQNEDGQDTGYSHYEVADCVRVQHLHHEDFLDLNWLQMDPSDDNKGYVYFNRELPLRNASYTGRYILQCINPGKHVYTIAEVIDVYEQDKHITRNELFMGIILNKHQLRQQMKMLGIRTFR